jgi:hypothetical protein
VNFNYNIPPKQKRIQQLVAQFNADEELWLSLETKRRRRRTLHPRMSVKLKRQLDLLEFARARPPQGGARLFGFFPLFTLIIHLCLNAPSSRVW